MTYDEYWKMDCELVRAYRKAYELKQQYDNSQLWLQGLYVYKALEAQRPGWNFWAKHPKTEKYLEKPIAITEELRKQYAAEETRKMAEQIKAAAHRRNQYLDKQGGGEDGESGSIRDSGQIQG